MTDTPVATDNDGWAVGFDTQFNTSPGYAVQTPTWNVTGELVAANQYIMAAGIWNPDQRILDTSTSLVSLTMAIKLS